VGIVGSRKVTPYGRAVTEKLARELAEQGIVIVSGLALGVDSIAHQACLEGRGGTIAVLPSSVEEVYPVAHRPLARRILERGGALVSEYPTGTPALRQNFIARNRLIAGLSDALLVTEAALKSGSLHTAGFALEQGKTVLAVPGNINSPTSEGTNNLLRTGAILVTSADDVLAALHLKRRVSKRQPVGETPAEQAILDLLAGGVQDGDQLQVRSGLAIELFNQSLTMLEINGDIKAMGGNQWTLR
jgi:DNA processing protein